MVFGNGFNIFSNNYHRYRLRCKAVLKNIFSPIDNKSSCVIDDDYPDGISKSLANDLSNLTGNSVEALGLEDRSAGFAKAVDNMPPDVNRIISKVRDAIK